MVENKSTVKCSGVMSESGRITIRYKYNQIHFMWWWWEEVQINISLFPFVTPKAQIFMTKWNKSVPLLMKKNNNCNNDFGLLDNSEMYSDYDDYDDNGKHRKFSLLSKRRQCYLYDDHDDGAAIVLLLVFPDSGFLSSMTIKLYLCCSCFFSLSSSNHWFCKPSQSAALFLPFPYFFQLYIL